VAHAAFDIATVLMGYLNAEAAAVEEAAAPTRGATSRPRPLPPTAINHVWAYDFVFDTCADGRTLKCLTIIDEFTRECLATDVAGGIRSARVIECSRTS
jgi:transposase InsO family protein